MNYHHINSEALLVDGPSQNLVPPKVAKSLWYQFVYRVHISTLKHGNHFK